MTTKDDTIHHADTLDDALAFKDKLPVGSIVRYDKLNYIVTETKGGNRLLEQQPTDEPGFLIKRVIGYKLPPKPEPVILTFDEDC
jgi:hypothetical protein